ncbi:hypothetical protein AKJ48_02730 [candidate division MSBL1 archaeon SCGC-AAA261O19]|uniref:4Fe-4S domain-containing protein n=1 Tax=candidate division MSBL1 archaeon SCGC-AAA261O19 TaxID=1698277 RepID=A0A133VD65_9EURY|nr:hypothetical protein AKJ48_02730 [candidate division MSBL1 archaeon SCGC-AAA261O19]
MEISAITAPKAAGMDSLVSRVVTDPEMREIAEDMRRIGKERDDLGFVRDGNNLMESDALLLIGTKEHSGLGLDCAACGFESCKEFNEAEEIDFEFGGPNCIFKLLDLGIALGSAAKTAAIHNVDSRIMYRIGVSARRLNFLDATIVIGIPLSAEFKSPYFNRET